MWEAPSRINSKVKRLADAVLVCGVVWLRNITQLMGVPIANSMSRESCREEEAQWHEAIC